MRYYVVTGVLGCLAFAYLLLIAVGPENSYGPFCTHDLSYRVRATIEVDGHQYTAQATRQRSFSRPWVAGLFSGGCPQTYGTVLAFRLNDDRVVLMGSRICRQAENAFAAPRPPGTYTDDFRAAMRERREVNLANYCYGLDVSRDKKFAYRFARTRWQAYLIDNGKQPARWEAFNFGGPLRGSDSQVRLLAATAQAMDARPRDELDRIAPGVLKTEFQRTRDSDHGPGELVSFQRRWRNPFSALKPEYRAIPAGVELTSAR